MEIDLLDSPELAHGADESRLEDRLRSQVCIVGGGIAGLILADLLSDKLTVTLLEAGGQLPGDALTEDPFGAELAGIRHAGTAQGRVRALGGCSLTWGGQLLGLPEDAGWPVASSDLLEGNRLWRVPADADAFLAGHGQPWPPLLKALPKLVPRLSRFVPFSQRNLARKPGRKLLASKSVKVVLNARATELLPDAQGERVAAVQVQTAAGTRICIRADSFVLAAGTVETCRLLLLSHRLLESATGRAQVGANFHDHLTVSAATFTGAARARILGELRPWILAPRRQRRSVYSLKLEPSAALREELDLLPAMAHITIEEPPSSGTGALRALLRARQGTERASFAGRIRVVPRMLAHLGRLGWEALVHGRRYVSPQAIVRLQINMAQETPSASRISLSDARDTAGVSRAKVDWRVDAQELASLRAFAGYLRGQLAGAGLGNDDVEWEPALFQQGPAADEALLARLDDARHAMGGTCMGTDPRKSVVDPDLRVYGVANLFVAGPAVFPDGSPQLPTLTLSALCLRLARTLKREFGK